MSVQRIVSNFARSAWRYDAHAQVQIQCADRLIAYLEANTRDLPEGTILELGCGTGIVSRRLVELFRDRDLELTDVCPEMLKRCEMRLGSEQPRHEMPRLHLTDGKLTDGKFSLAAIDIETFEAEKRHALVVVAFVLQWMRDLQAALENCTAAVQPGGKMFFSVPTAGSFPEWRAVCKQAGVGYTGNQLPSAAEFRAFAERKGMRLSIYEETFPVHHQSLQQFLVSLKSLGAGTALGPARLTVSETKRLLTVARAMHPNSFTATYKVLFGHLTVPES
jgi:malonyl-CoA O-methyltransferase